MKKVVLLILLLLVAFAVWCTLAYNRIIRADENVSAAWGKVENVCRRRTDMLPSKLAMVRRAGYSSDTLAAVVSAREAAAICAVADLSEEETARYRSVQDALDKALDDLSLAVSFRPEEQSGGECREALASLEGIGEKIYTAGSLFNDASSEYNTLVRTFPGNLLAAVFKFGLKGSF